MSLQMSFNDHEGFQRNAIYWTLAGAAGGLLALLGRTLFTVAPEASYTTFLVGVGACVGLTCGLLRGRWSHLPLGAFAGAGLGALGAFISGVNLDAAPLLGAAAAGLGLGALWGPPQAPRFARGVAFAIAAVVGTHILHTLVLNESALAFLQLPGVRDATAGGLLGLFLSLGGALGRLSLNTDPIHALWDERREHVHGDMRELAERSVSLYDEIQQRLERRRAEVTGPAAQAEEATLNDTRRVAQETTERLIRLAERWCAVEGSVDDALRPRLDARLKALETKIEAAQDAVVRAEYQAAAASLREQLASFERIHVARERLVARIHRCHTSLEQVAVTLLHLSTTDAQNASLALQPELERLAQMSEGFSWKTLSVDDLCAMEEEAAVTPSAA